MNTQSTIRTLHAPEDIVELWRRSWSGDATARQALLRRIMPASSFPAPAPLPFAAPRLRADRAA